MLREGEEDQYHRIERTIWSADVMIEGLNLLYYGCINPLFFSLISFRYSGLFNDNEKFSVHERVLLLYKILGL